MKAASFVYERPKTRAEALGFLQDGRGRVLAGGQSLVPSLNMRLDSPERIVDINHVGDFSGIVHHDGAVHVGALVRHEEAARSPLVRRHLPLFAIAMTHVAHPAIRNRGTTCGSLAHADPAAEIPACAVALDAELVLESASGKRNLKADDFFRGLYETARRDDEMITEVIFPEARPDQFFAFEELAARHGDFASVGVAIIGALADGVINALTIVVFASEPRPMICRAAADFAHGRRLDARTIEAIGQLVADEMQPLDNQQGRPDTKKHQAKILCTRALRSAVRETIPQARHHAS